jgi:hypothetical protein
MPAVDLTGGLPLEADHCLLNPEPVPLFSENFWFVGFDAESGIGYWLHLGAHANRFDLWNEGVVVYLPGADDFVHYFGDGRQREPATPGAANLRFHCVEPFRRWRITYEAMGTPTTAAAMAEGPVRLDRRVPVGIDLGIECMTPAWGSTHEQRADGEHGEAGFSSHYEQLYRADGTFAVDGRSFAVRGTGLRDHSRGPRNLTFFGTHALQGALFPSGRAFGLLRILDRDGKPLVDGGWFYEGGRFRTARVLEVTPLTSLAKRGEGVVVRLDAGDGPVTITGVSLTNLLMTMVATSEGLVGVAWDDDENRVLSEAFIHWTWDGEESDGILERTAPAGALRR